MRSRLGSSEGFTVVELLVVVVVLGVILTGLVNVMVSGTHAQSDVSGRVDAQQGVRIALDRLEYEARCASYAAPVSSGAGISLTLPSQCSHATGNVTWCVSGGVLYRYTSSSCSGTAETFVRSVTSPTPFSMTWVNGDLPRLLISLSVDDAGASSDSFTTSETVALRNATESVGTPSPATGAVGSSVTITGTGFKPSTALTVTFGSVPATITSGGTSGADGSVNATFTVPFSGNGSYNVTVSDGTFSLTSSTTYTVTGSFVGLALTSPTHTNNGALSCGSIAQSNTCNFDPLGYPGNFTGKITFETAAGVTVSNSSGSSYTVTATGALVTSPGGTVSPSSSTIANAASSTAGSFQMTGLGVGWKETMTNSVTVNGVAYTLAITGW